MSRRRPEFSRYQALWIVAMFDLPTDSPARRKRYALFRKELLRLGFSMLQFSVYARYFVSEEKGDVHVSRIEAALPPEGQVRLLAVTDRQFAKMRTFSGKCRRETESPPAQLLLF